jgi:hypothetical protein
MIAWLVGLTAAVAGGSQAWLLDRSLRRGSHPLQFFVRFGLVAAALALSVRAGLIWAGALGWFVGFASGVVLACERPS